MTEQSEREQFWSRVSIPINDEYATDGSAPVNPVTVADKFIEAFGLGVQLASEAEGLSETVLDITEEIKAQERILKRIRLAVMKAKFDDVKTSWKEDMVEAFVLCNADSQQLGELEAAYESIDTLEEELVGPNKRLETLTKRFKTHVTLMEWAREFVNYDKYQGNLNRVGR